MICYCDLEETLITSWSDALLTNVGKIKPWFEAHGVKEIHIFSFACWNETDKYHFNAVMRAPIEAAFGVKVHDDVLTTEDIRQIVCRHLVAHFDLHDFLSLWGKRRAFVEFCDAIHKDEVCVLLDDCVPDLTYVNHTTNVRTELIKIAFKHPVRNINS